MKRIVSLVVVGVLATCSSPPKPVPKPPPVEVAKPEHAKLLLDVAPGDAEVDIDGTTRGAASTLQETVMLDPGAHQIIIRKPGFVTWRGEVEITDKTEKISVQLVPEK